MTELKSQVCSKDSFFSYFKNTLVRTKSHANIFKILLSDIWVFLKLAELHYDREWVTSMQIIHNSPSEV